MMKLLSNKGTFDILASTDNPLQLIEAAGRTCYQSADKITKDSADTFVRMLIGRGHLSVLEHASVTVRFSNHSRGFTHELVRHRLAAFSQESTRYVKQDDLHFVLPPGMEKTTEVELRGGFSGLLQGFAIGDLVRYMEAAYSMMLRAGWAPEDARQFLPIGTVSQIVATANFREWRHIFTMRTAKAAHWEIRRTMIRLLGDFAKRWPAAFADLQG